jgi:hypothetical protein
MADELTRGERSSANAAATKDAGVASASQLPLVGALVGGALGMQVLQRLDVDFAAL